MDKNIGKLNIVVTERDDPASGVHLLIEAIIEFAKKYAEQCGYDITIEKSFNDE